MLNAGRLVSTVSDALDIPLLPALDVRSPDVLVTVPAVLDVTLTETEHDELGATLPLDKEIVDPPSGADTEVPTPGRPLLPSPTLPHVVVALEGVAIVTPAGRVFVNARFVTRDPLPFVIWNVSVLALPGAIVDGLNDCVNVGCANATEGASARSSRSRSTGRGGRCLRVSPRS